MSIDLEKAAIGLGVCMGLAREGYAPSALEKIGSALPQGAAMQDAVKEAQRLYHERPAVYAWLEGVLSDPKVASVAGTVADVVGDAAAAAAPVVAPAARGMVSPGTALLGAGVAAAGTGLGGGLAGTMLGKKLQQREDAQNPLAATGRNLAGAWGHATNKTAAGASAAAAPGMFRRLWADPRRNLALGGMGVGVGGLGVGAVGGGLAGYGGGRAHQVYQDAQNPLAATGRNLAGWAMSR